MARKKDQSIGAMDALRPDIRAAAARMGSRLRDPGELAPVEGYLREHETVTFAVQGTYQRAGGVLVLSDARLIFFHRRVQKPSLDLSLGAIGRVTTSAGRRPARSRSPSARRRSRSRGSSRAMSSRSPTPSGGPWRRPRTSRAVDPAAPVDPFVAMEKLAALRDSGVLTEAEFAAKKQELLDRL